MEQYVEIFFYTNFFYTNLFYTKLFAFLHQNCCFFTPIFVFFTPQFLPFYTNFLLKQFCFFYIRFLLQQILKFRKIFFGKKSKEKIGVKKGTPCL